jgi:hypothetical protein
LNFQNNYLIKQIVFNFANNPIGVCIHSNFIELIYLQNIFGINNWKINLKTLQSFVVSKSEDNLKKK